MVCCAAGPRSRGRTFGQGRRLAVSYCSAGRCAGSAGRIQRGDEQGAEQSVAGRAGWLAGMAIRQAVCVCAGVGQRESGGRWSVWTRTWAEGEGEEQCGGGSISGWCLLVEEGRQIAAVLRVGSSSSRLVGGLQHGRRQSEREMRAARKRVVAPVGSV